MVVLARATFIPRARSLFLSLTLSHPPRHSFPPPTLSYPPVLRERARVDRLSLVGATYPPPPSPMDVRIPPLFVLLLRGCVPYPFTSSSSPRSPPKRYDRKGKGERGVKFRSCKIEIKSLSRLKDRDVIVAATRVDVHVGINSS